MTQSGDRWGQTGHLGLELRQAEGVLAWPQEGLWGPSRTEAQGTATHQPGLGAKVQRRLHTPPARAALGGQACVHCPVRYWWTAWQGEARGNRRRASRFWVPGAAGPPAVRELHHGQPDDLNQLPAPCSLSCRQRAPLAPPFCVTSPQSPAAPLPVPVCARQLPPCFPGSCVFRILTPLCRRRLLPPLSPKTVPGGGPDVSRAWGAGWGCPLLVAALQCCPDSGGTDLGDGMMQAVAKHCTAGSHRAHLGCSRGVALGRLRKQAGPSLFSALL